MKTLIEMRTEFEAWAQDNKSLFDLDEEDRVRYCRIESHSYTTESLNVAWQAWVAATNRVKITD